MYASKNFPTKTAFKKAVAGGQRITLYEPGLGTPPMDGTASVEGPWKPKPHTWYARAEVKNGVVIKVS